RSTSALILSPGWSAWPTSTVPAGAISYQVKYVGVPSKHQLAVPSCSTVLSENPSRPTQSEVISSSWVQRTLGVRHCPLTCVKVPVVPDTSAYPDQLYAPAADSRSEEHT